MNNGEVQARRAIEDQGFIVHDANVLFGANCRNIDLVVYGKERAFYVQVKTSSRPPGKIMLQSMSHVGPKNSWMVRHFSTDMTACAQAS